MRSHHPARSRQAGTNTRRDHPSRRDELARGPQTRVFDDRLRLGSSASGLHTITQLRDGANDRSVSIRLARGGIDAQPLSRYYHDTPSTPGLFLGYMALNPRDIENAVRKMARLL